MNKVVLEIGKNFLFDTFSGKRFNNCLPELIKNSRDWGAANVWIDTSNPKLFRILDDGVGMNAANRTAVLSVAKTTGGKRNQSSKFGSGMKHFLFSHSVEVTITTVSEEEPETVYILQGTVEEIDRLLRARGGLEIKRLKKSAKSWPHGFETGTDIAFTLKDPKSKTILRGESLRTMLAARLPMWFENVVFVDGERLPRKDIHGEPFKVNVQHPKLGPLSVELYRPKNSRQEEGVLLAAHEVGEVPIANLDSLLKSTPLMVPEVFLNRAVCGTIACRLFQEHANENRNSLSQDLLDDPTLPDLINFLDSIDEGVQHKLGVRVEGPVSDSVRAKIDEVIKVFQERSASEPLPEGHTLSEGDMGASVTEEDTAPIANRPKNPLTLRIPRREFALGETFEVEPVLSGELKGTNPEIVWLTKHSNCTVETLPDGRLSCTATAVGSAAFVEAEARGTRDRARASFSVVRERKFGLTRTNYTVSAGDELVLRTKNRDLLAGEPEWYLKEVATLAPQPDGSATFTSAYPGTYTVSVNDSLNPDELSRGLIRVTPNKGNDLINIKGVWFQCHTWQLKENHRPVTMRHGGYEIDAVHRLEFNSEAPSLKQAEGQFLIWAIAAEFARFCVTYLERDDYLDKEPEDIVSEAQELMFEVVEESMKKK